MDNASNTANDVDYADYLTPHWTLADYAFADTGLIDDKGRRIGICSDIHESAAGHHPAIVITRDGHRYGHHPRGRACATHDEAVAALAVKMAKAIAKLAAKFPRA